MRVREFGRNFAEKLRRVFESRTPRTVTRYGREYVTVVPADTWREAEQALAEKRAREMSDENGPSYVAVITADRWREAEQALAEKRAREQNREVVPV